MKFSTIVVYKIIYQLNILNLGSDQKCVLQLILPILLYIRYLQTSGMTFTIELAFSLHELKNNLFTTLLWHFESVVQDLPVDLRVRNLNPLSVQGHRSWQIGVIWKLFIPTCYLEIGVETLAADLIVLDVVECAFRNDNYTRRAHISRISDIYYSFG